MIRPCELTQSVMIRFEDRPQTILFASCSSFRISTFVATSYPLSLLEIRIFGVLSLRLTLATTRLSRRSITFSVPIILSGLLRLRRGSTRAWIGVCSMPSRKPIFLFLFHHLVRRRCRASRIVWVVRMGAWWRSIVVPIMVSVAWAMVCGI